MQNINLQNWTYAHSTWFIDNWKNVLGKWKIRTIKSKISRVTFYYFWHQLWCGNSKAVSLANSLILKHGTFVAANWRYYMVFDYKYVKRYFWHERRENIYSGDYSWISENVLYQRFNIIMKIVFIQKEERIFFLHKYKQSTNLIKTIAVTNLSEGHKL